jgi:hypothetical protein
LTLQTENQSLQTLKLYAPLIFAIVVVLVVTMIITSFSHDFMNALMGTSFVVFAIPKLVNLSGFASAFAHYDLISQKLHWYAKAYPFLELAIGILYLIDNGLRFTRLDGVLDGLVIIITIIGIIGVLRSMHRKQDLYCACLGTFFKFPLSKVTITENSIMLIMAASMLVIAMRAPM